MFLTLNHICPNNIKWAWIDIWERDDINKYGFGIWERKRVEGDSSDGLGYGPGIDIW